MEVSQHIGLQFLKKGGRASALLESLEPRILLSNDHPISYAAAAGTAVELTHQSQELDSTETPFLINEIES